MQLITGAQARMARSLLNWSRAKLAKESHVGRGTIRTFEEDKAVRESCILDLHSVFDAHGVQFTADGGVKAREDGLTDFRGVGSCDRFFDHLEKMVKEKGGEVICMTDSQTLLTKSTGLMKRTNLERMEELHKVVDVKCLLTDSKIILPTCPSFEIRVLPEMPVSTPYSVWAYENEFTQALEFDPKFHFQHPVYMVLESPDQSHKVFEAFRARWTFSKPYPFSGKAAKAA